MIKKICFPLFFVFCFSYSAHSFTFSPSVSLLGSYTTTNNDAAIRSGLFDIQNRKVNFGLEFTNKFYLSEHYFIRTGLRYNKFKTTINGKNQIPALLDQPSPLYWDRGYRSVTIPIEFGWGFVTRKGNRGDFYIGLSAGLISTSSATNGVSSALPRNSNSTDTLTSMITDNADYPASFFSTLDIGGNYQIFTKVPRFSVGFLCSAQLSKAYSSSYHGTVKYGSQGPEFVYDMQNQQRYVNCGLTLSYTFGKQKQSLNKNNKLACPE